MQGEEPSGGLLQYAFLHVGGENPNWDDILGQAADGTKWTRWDVVLKADGKPIWYDGAYCMDPTHPYTKKVLWQISCVRRPHTV